MNIKKSLLALVVLALAMTGLASSAMAATDGVIRDVTTNEIIPENHELHAIGWAKFSSSLGSFECHVTSIVKATKNTEGLQGRTGDVTNFSIPNTANCTGHGGLAECKLKKDTITNLPWHATATPPSETNPAGDIDITPGTAGNIVIDNEFEGGFLCPAKVELVFTAITLTPLKTGTTAITGGASPGHLGGGTAALNDPIAGIEISGKGTSPQVGEITASGELELTEPDRCTWKIASS